MWQGHVCVRESSDATSSPIRTVRRTERGMANHLTINKARNEQEAHGQPHGLLSLPARTLTLSSCYGPPLLL